jgi:bis(5'-nucleosidyl)-tetraphosphatase
VVAGCIVFRRSDEGIKFLLLYRRGAYWNFPKGHFEQGENSLDAALRETEEETGIKRTELRILKDFRAYERFTFRSGRERIHDTVILYLAETKQFHVTLSPREHSGFAWFLLQDAMKILGKYQGTKHALKKAYDFIRRQGSARPPAGRHGAPPRHAGHSYRPAGRTPHSQR